ncbi:MAG: ribosome recycling factor [Bacteroidetes bacterium]|nr:MAG: ribosome recycling factor [Bacteroidota bacterium]
MNEEFQIIFDECRDANQGSINHLETELQKIRAGKASPSMLKGVSVDYYGSPTPLEQVANVSTLDARTITVQPWEKNILNDVATAIINSNLGFSPQNNGEMLIISVPPLTEERRKDLVKKSRSEVENAKISIRNNRKEALDMIKGMKDGVSEDLVKDAESQIQNITDSFIKKADEHAEAKEKDIMTI